jgi:hypothetical protein
VIPVVCCHSECREWGVAYTTLEDNPKPWATIPDGFEGVVVPEPLWYVCKKHLTPRHHPLPENGAPPVCEFCGSADQVTWVTSPTLYERKVSVWDWIHYGPNGPPDPNRAHALCADCAERERDFWAEQWKEYRSSQGI